MERRRSTLLERAEEAPPRRRRVEEATGTPFDEMDGVLEADYLRLSGRAEEQRLAEVGGTRFNQEAREMKTLVEDWARNPGNPDLFMDVWRHAKKVADLFGFG